MDAREIQHQKGKLYVTERLDLLFDKAEYTELCPPEERDGVYVCMGNISTQKVVVAAQDFTYKGGSLGNKHGTNIAHGLDVAIRERVPFICINDSGGARIQEGVSSLAAYGDIFYRNTKASGYIPQISVIAGPCAGGASYSPGLTDFVFVLDNISQMFITGPAVVKSVTFQEVTPEDLGGAGVHAQTSGVAHFRCHTEMECIEQLRSLIKMLPANNGVKPVFHKKLFASKATKPIELPEQKAKAYDVRKVIKAIFDDEDFLEIQAEFAKSIVIGFARLQEMCVGIVANQPNHMAGVLDCDSSDKAARFVRYCDAFNIPIISFTDVPGYLPGIAQEGKGIIRHGAKLLYAFSEATVPRINIITRKSYGGAYIAMNSKHLGADYVLSWAGAEVAVMGESGAVQILYGKEASKLPPEEKARFLEEKSEQYKATVMNCDKALEEGYIDEQISPEQTRRRLIEIMPKLMSKSTAPLSKKHGCMPL